MKHFYSLFILFALCALHANAFTVNGISYEVTGAKTVKVVAKWPNYSGTVTIPRIVTYSGVSYTVNEIGNQCFLDAEFLESVSLPSTLLTIGTNAFEGCVLLNTVTIPNSVNYIGARAFANCSKLSKVTLGNNLTSIESGVFFHCANLKDITLPNSVTAIRALAFAHSGIEQINIFKNVKTIEDFAFDDCTSLKRILIDDLTFWCSRDFDNINMNPLSQARNLYLNNKLLTSINIPNGITTIKPFVFAYCSANEVVFPASVKAIDLSAFRGCSRIKTVLIPNTVTQLISDNLDGYAPFPDATKLIIGNGIKTIPKQAFDFCYKMYSIIIYEGVETLDYNAFRYCGFSNIVLPKTIRTLNAAFYSCNKLEEITLNPELKRMEGAVFSGCGSLTAIHSRVKDPNQMEFVGSSHFNKVKTNTCVLYVPKGCVQVYRNHPYWSVFDKIQEEELITDVDRNGKTDVEDLNIVINQILNLEYAGANAIACDVDLNGKVDVEDVNAVINAILLI